MKSRHAYWTSLLRELFDDARKNGGIEYIYTLVRVTGIGEGPDQLISLKLILDELDNKDQSELAQACKKAVDCEDIYILLINLIRCATKVTYASHPFSHLYEGAMFERIKPTNIQVVHELVNIAIQQGKPKLARIIEQIFSNDILSFFQDTNITTVPANLKDRMEDCYYFLKTFLNMYYEERLSFKSSNKFYKCPGFEVLELLTNEEYGLFGFKMYFSNSTFAYFMRTLENTDCLNICDTNPVNFQIGLLNDLKNEWMVGQKRLYEIGLPGRYNNLGEWKPIVHPASPEHLIKEAKSASDDPDVQGAYFYMLCTGYKVIEFVVRTTLDLPDEFTTLGNNFHLWKCPNKEVPSFNDNNQLYDGWVNLEDCSIEHIEATIRGIGLALNIIGFTYGAPIDWRIKYKMIEQSEAKASPTSEDLDILDTMLKKIPYEGNDALVLSYAIDWYVRGRTSKNIFMRFLSYYIALESVASAIAEGEADFGIGYQKESKAERKKKRIEGINQLYNDFFKTDPIKFVSEAYFEYVLSLKSRTRRVVELVFGTGNKYIDMLFEKTGIDDPPLNDIRGKLAHGSIAFFSKEDENLVRNHLHEIENISKEFLIRLILQLKPTDDLPSWSGTYRSGLVSVDPRSTQYCTTLDIFPKAEWKIRAEWID